MTAAINEALAQRDSVSPPKRKRAPAKAKPKAELPKPEAPKEFSPYPDGVQVFTYQPKDGSEPILLAMNGFERPNKLWFFDLAEMPRLAQTWAWMTAAGIPRAIQRQAQLLPDPEYFAMFDAWFNAMSQRQGAVNSGK